MINSGIKRGLATTAVTALAIAGLPLIAASPASADTGDELLTAFAGPARNGGTEGAVVVLETKDGAAPNVPMNSANFKLIRSDLSGDASLPQGAPNSGSPNNANQTVTLVSAGPIQADGPTNEFGNGDGYGESTLRVAVTTPAPGGTATFAVFHDDDNDNVVDAGEARTQVSITTAGAPTSVDITPNSQVAPAGQQSGNYTATIKDNAGRTTQLTGGETITLAATGGTTIDETNPGAVDNNSVSATEAPRGTATFKAANNNPGGYTITATGANGVPASATGQATLNVVTAANITANEVDVVTGADDWPTNPANRNYANPVKVRVDQSSITLQFDSNDPNSTVAFTATTDGGNGITFDGKTSKQYSVVLDSQGKGSVTITPDAGTIQDGDGMTIVGSGLNLTVDFERVTAQAPDVRGVNAQETTYISKIGGSVDVVVKVVDGFGQPVTSGFVNVRRSGGANNETTFTAKKPVGSDGTVTFTLTDTKATANSTAPDTVLAQYFVDEFAPNPADGPESVGTIRYTADGTGNPISFTVDNTSVDGTGYNASQVTLNPLTVDGNATSQSVGANTTNDEYVVIGIVGGTPGVDVTVSADNGGLILKNPTAATDEVADGKSSVTGSTNDTYWLIATKTGAVNVTVASAGKSKTAAVTSVPVPAAAGGVTTARNVSVTGPSAANPGDLVNFVAIVTDGYGNPIEGVSFGTNVRVTGPAALQDTDASSNAKGEIGIAVRIFDDANSPVTVTVSGLRNFGYQFGDAVNTINNAPGGANNAPGIPASVSSASATIEDIVNLEELEKAVEEAEAALAVAEGDLTEAQADLDVAQTELAIAISEVDRLRERKAELRKKLNKAKADGNRQKAKTTRKKLRKAKSDLRDAKEAREIAQTDVNGLQKVVDDRQAAVTEAEQALEEAKQNLEDAKK